MWDNRAAGIRLYKLNPAVFVWKKRLPIDYFSAYMRLRFIYFVGIIVGLTINIESRGQHLSTVDSINKYCDSITNDKNLKTILLRQDFGGIVEGYFLNDSLVRITHAILHVSVYQEDYYFKDGMLIMVRRIKRIQGYADSLGQKMRTVFENHYYFQANKLFKVIKTGGKVKLKYSTKELEKELLDDAFKYRAFFLHHE